MSRSYTAEKPSFNISRPQKEVSFIFNFDSVDRGPFVTVRIPERSRWTPDPHWHERYAEYIRVVQGRLRIVLDGRARVVTPEDGEQCINPFVVHEFMRADVDLPKNERDAGDVMVEERVDPADGLKETFFRNLFSTMQDSSNVFGKTTPLQIMLTSAAFDNFDIFVSGGLAYYFTHGIYAAVRTLSWVIGLKPWYDEYTPQRLRSVASSGGVATRPKIL